MKSKIVASLFFCCTLSFGLTLTLQAQDITFEEYEPISGLKVPDHPTKRAKYPFIDIHSHQNANMSKADLARLVKDMDALNLQTMVNLSGGSGSELKSGVANMKGNYPTRFLVFANINFNNVDDPDFGRKAAAQLEQDVRNGAQGLKIFKNLGLTVTDKNGKRIQTDDPRLDPIWAKCAELKIPVLIHTGEPKQFFDPHDKHNERWLELKQFPNRARPASKYPSWEIIMAEQHRMFKKHPKTIFINAHLGWMATWPALVN